MSTTINVTAEHIAQGVQAECTRCPIALAIGEALPDATYVSVNLRAIELTDGPHEVYLQDPLPIRARAFIREFDNGWPVRPFSFELPYPAVTQ